MSKSELFSHPSRVATKSGASDTDTDFTCIVSYETITPMLSEMCEKLSRPMSLIQWTKDESKEDRVDPNAALHLRPSCANFRRAAGEKYCKTCDAVHASVFHGLKREELDALTDEKVQETLRNNINKLTDAEMKQVLSRWIDDAHIKGIGENVYIEYICPMMGYLEDAFPILFEEAVIGVVVSGQIRTTASEPKEREIIDFFYKTIPPKKIFKVYKEKYEKHLKEKREPSPKGGVLQTIWDAINNPAKWFLPDLSDSEERESFYGYETHDILTTGEYEKVIALNFKKFSELRKKLQAHMREKRQRYVKRVMESALERFFERDNAAAIERAKSKDAAVELDSFWENIESFFDEIRKPLNLQYVAAFGMNEIQLFSEKRLPLVCFSHDGQKERGEPKIFFDFGQVADLKNATDEEEEERLFESLFYIPYIDKPYAPDGKTNTPKSLFSHLQSQTADSPIFLFPVHDKPQSSVALLTEFSLPEDLIKAQKERLTEIRGFDDIITAFRGQIKASGHMLFSRWVARMASQEENATKSMMRVYRHEIGHVAFGLDGLSDDFSDPSFQMNEKFKQDYRYFLKQLDALQDNIRRILGAPYRVAFEETAYSWIFEELLYKWQKRYQKRTEEKFVSVCMPGVFSSDELRAPHKVDKLLIDQIVYNLLDNAVKYSYWGTNIYMDFSRYYRDSSARVLTVTSFGPEIEKDFDPFLLFSRGKEGKIHGGDSSGIGLYVVKRAAILMGGEARYTSEKILDRHVPFLLPYIERGAENGEPEKLIRQAKERLLWLKQSMYKPKVLTQGEQWRAGVNGWRSTSRTIYGDILSDSLGKKQFRDSWKQIEWKQIKDGIRWPTYKNTFEVIL